MGGCSQRGPQRKDDVRADVGKRNRTPVLTLAARERIVTQLCWTELLAEGAREEGVGASRALVPRLSRVEAKPPRKCRALSVAEEHCAIAAPAVTALRCGCRIHPFVEIHACA